MDELWQGRRLKLGIRDYYRNDDVDFNGQRIVWAEVLDGCNAFAIVKKHWREKNVSEATKKELGVPPMDTLKRKAHGKITTTQPRRGSERVYSLGFVYSFWASKARCTGVCWLSYKDLCRCASFLWKEDVLCMHAKCESANGWSMDHGVYQKQTITKIVKSLGKNSPTIRQPLANHFPTTGQPLLNIGKPLAKLLASYLFCSNSYFLIQKSFCWKIHFCNDNELAHVASAKLANVDTSIGQPFAQGNIHISHHASAAAFWPKLQSAVAKLRI